MRRFDQAAAVPLEALRELVDLARITASSANRQPLKYVLSCDAAVNARIFAHLGWAAYLGDWPGPAEGERPAAYIVILGDTTITRSFGCDAGITAQTIMLAATERDLGGCMIGSVNRAGLARTLGLAEHLEVVLTLALGRPTEQVRLEELGPDGDIRYYRGADGVHHVPKRALDAIIVAEHG